MAVNIYIAGCDSIFYCEGEIFDIKKIQGSKSNDSIFINQLLDNITKGNKKVLFKPYEGKCGDGGLGERVMNVKSLLIQNNVEFTISNTDSSENVFFNDISVLDMFANLQKPPPPPPVLVVTSPNISSQEVKKPFFQFLLKSNGVIYYSYDSTDFDRNLLVIDHPTKEKLLQILTAFEKSHQMLFSEETIPVIVRGNASAKYPEFKIIKDALKAKDLFKFKMVTIDDGTPPPLKAPDKETAIIITAKTLTLLFSATDEIYYYHGTDCSSIIKASKEQIKTVLKAEKLHTSLKDLLVIVKQEEAGSFKAVVDIMTDVALAKIPYSHYAEKEITGPEINCIKNYKTK